MAFAITFEEPILMIRFANTFTDADFRALAVEADRIEGSFDVVPHRLADLRPVTRLEITFKGVLEFAEQRLRRTFPNAFKSAIVAGDLAQFGFARMFQTLNDHPQISIAIFPDEAAATQWLAQPGLDLPRRPWAPHASAS